jgi:RNA polymerase sigma-70 factor (ECF subfamily)
MPEDLESIDTLVERFQAGVDRGEIFAQIYSQYYFAVHRFFIRHGFPEEESRELTQDTFLRVFSALESFRGESRFETWLFSVAIRVRWNALRARHSEKRSGLEQSLDSDPAREGGPTLEIVDPGPDPESQAIRTKQISALRYALQGFPEQMRRCCKLRYEDGLKYQEIATVMNISLAAVKAHLHQARKRLQEKLGGAEEP